MSDKNMFVLKIVWRKSIASLHCLTQDVQPTSLRCTAGDPTWVPNLFISMWLDAYPSPHNGLTMCVGSYASRIDNKVEDIVNEFADKVNFVHLRNVRKVQNGSFVESDHIDGDVDMFKVISTLLFEQDRRKKMGVRHQARLRLPFR